MQKTARVSAQEKVRTMVWATGRETAPGAVLKTALEKARTAQMAAQETAHKLHAHVLRDRMFVSTRFRIPLVFESGSDGVG